MARPSLSEAFAPVAAEPTSEPTPTTAPETMVAARPPSRLGLKAVTVYVDPAAHRQLRILAIESDTSAQALLVDAVNDLFQKHGKPRIA